MNFTTGLEGGRFTFTGSSKLGERVEWHGHVSVQPIESDGEFRIDGLQAHTIWEYLEDRLNFAVNSGAIDLQATYKFSLKDAVDFQANLSKIALNDLAVRAKGADADWVTVPSLLVSGTTVDLAKRQAHVDSLSLTGVKLVTWLEPDGSFNLLKLAQSPTAPAAAAAGAAAPVTPAASAAAWTVDLREFALKDANISAEDRSTSPAAKVVLAPLSITVNGASLDLAKPLTMTLDTRINDAGSLNVSGDVTPQPLSANVAMKLADIDLKAVQPYIAKFTSMTLLGGRVSGDAKLRYGPQQPAMQLGRQFQHRRDTHGRQRPARRFHQLGSFGHRGDQLPAWPRSAGHRPDSGAQAVCARHRRTGQHLECDAGIGGSRCDRGGAGACGRLEGCGDGCNRAAAGAGQAHTVQSQGSGAGVCAARDSGHRSSGCRGWGRPVDADGHQENRAACQSGQFRGPVGTAEFRHRHSEHRGNGDRAVLKS
jgi:hypothetical protein